MFRSGGQPVAKPPMFTSQASWVLIYRPTEMSTDEALCLGFLEHDSPKPPPIHPNSSGLGSNPGEDMDVYKCIVPLRHGGTLNSRRDASREVGGREIEVGDSWPPPGFSPTKYWGGTEQLSPAWCSKLKLTTGVKILALNCDEFRGPRSDFVRQCFKSFVDLAIEDDPSEFIHQIWL
ncbi:hypothetical protein TNCV_4890841 [Trichonephila clavipes]|nr:hypothetical protein TNCV_4890841 [Trichonephila clavipes]